MASSRDATQRRERQIRTQASGCSITVLLLGGFALWSRPREAAWDAGGSRHEGGCRHEIDDPGGAAPGVEVRLHAFRTCAGPPGDGEVRLRARACGAALERGGAAVPEHGLPRSRTRSLPGVGS
ncbi:hypothetical protein [Sorangium sp. So ce406]|uniref:hypothetical protein n=1 Tax=Sorangium sp. So ce406 TaxID=3133311 RepID=UPI003F5B4ED1